MTCAWEIWEQLGRHAPDVVVCPVGHGGLFLGLARGFRALLTAGVIGRMPRMIAVQAAGCNPVVQAWERGLDVPEPVPQSPSVADGIGVTRPVHGAEILAVIHETGGTAVQINDMMIKVTHQALGKQGFIVEPTSAVPVAALRLLRDILDDKETIIIPFTGNGLKTLRS
jgi:threonine synthase